MLRATLSVGVVAIVNGRAVTASRTIAGIGGPVAIPTFAVGHRVNHCTIASRSVVASFTPCSVTGTFPRGATGNTGQPSVAYSSAAEPAGVNAAGSTTAIRTRRRWLAPTG